MIRLVRALLGYFLVAIERSRGERLVLVRGRGIGRRYPRVVILGEDKRTSPTGCRIAAVVLAIGGEDMSVGVAA